MLMRSRPKSAGCVNHHGALAVKDGHLRNCRGEPVALAGMSLFWSQWAGRFYTEAWINRLVREWKVDIVRAAIGVGPDGYLVNPHRERDKLWRVIDAAIAAGIYLIADWHSSNRHTDEASACFAEIARRYASAPNILYETWNEPGRDDWVATVRPHHQAVIDALRAYDPDAVVICGTPSQCRDIEVATQFPIDRDNVCYALHFYAGTHRQGLRDRADAALRSGVCVFVTEYGLAEADGDGVVDIAEATRWWRFLEKHGVSYVNWSFFDKPEACSALVQNKGLRRMFSSHRLSVSGRAVFRHLRHRSVELAPAKAAIDC